MSKKQRFKNTQAFASGCGDVCSALKVIIGLHVVAAAKSLSICLDLISGDGVI